MKCGLLRENYYRCWRNTSAKQKLDDKVWKTRTILNRLPFLVRYVSEETNEGVDRRSNGRTREGKRPFASGCRQEARLSAIKANRLDDENCDKKNRYSIVLHVMASVMALATTRAVDMCLVCPQEIFFCINARFISLPDLSNKWK